MTEEQVSEGTLELPTITIKPLPLEKEDNSDIVETPPKVEKPKRIRNKPVRSPEQIEAMKQKRLDALARGREKAHRIYKEKRERLRILEELAEKGNLQGHQPSHNGDRKAIIDEEQLADKITNRILEKFEKIKLDKGVAPDVKRMVPRNSDVLEAMKDSERLREQVVAVDPEYSKWIEYKKKNNL